MSETAAGSPLVLEEGQGTCLAGGLARSVSTSENKAVERRERGRGKLSNSDAGDGKATANSHGQGVA